MKNLFEQCSWHLFTTLIFYFQALVEEIETAMTVFAHGLNDIILDRTQTEENISLMTRSNVSCYNNSPVPWSGGKMLR